MVFLKSSMFCFNLSSDKDDIEVSVAWKLPSAPIFTFWSANVNSEASAAPLVAIIKAAPVWLFAVLWKNIPDLVRFGAV